MSTSVKTATGILLVWKLPITQKPGELCWCIAGEWKNYFNPAEGNPSIISSLSGLLSHPREEMVQRLTEGALTPCRCREWSPGMLSAVWWGAGLQHGSTGRCRRGRHGPRHTGKRHETTALLSHRILWLSLALAHAHKHLKGCVFTGARQEGYETGTPQNSSPR